MELLYNSNHKKIHIDDFQHPADKRTVNTLIKLPAFQKILTFLSENTVEKTYNLMNDSSFLKISEKMSPKIFSMIKEAMDMFDVDVAPRVYVDRNYAMTVKLDGMKSPYLVFSSSVLEQYDDGMLWALIASEIAGIKASHATIKFVDNIIQIAKPIFPFAIDVAVTLALNDWYRNKAYTYDRAILLASEDFEMTARHILFGEADLTTLENLHLSQPNNDYYKQAYEFLQRSGINGVYQKISTVFSREQWMASRYIELYNWYFGGQYEDILERSKCI